MRLRMRRRIKPELLLPLLLPPLPLLLLPPLLQPLAGPKNRNQSVPSVAGLDMSLRGALSLRRLARRLRRKSAMTPQNHDLMARLMRQTRLPPWNLQERQVSVRPPLPAPCLTLGMQTQGPLLI